MPALKVGVEILQDAHNPARLGAGAVGRHRHPVHVDVHSQFAGQVGHDHYRALEHTDQQRPLTRVIGFDAASQFGQLGPDLGLRLTSTLVRSADTSLASIGTYPFAGEDEQAAPPFNPNARKVEPFLAVPVGDQP